MRWGVWVWFKCVLILVLVSPKPVLPLSPNSLRQFKTVSLSIQKSVAKTVSLPIQEIDSKNCFDADSEIGSKNQVTADFW
jgi:hypothetical protein